MRLRGDNSDFLAIMKKLPRLHDTIILLQQA
jgi:hypothetical protein